MFIFHHSHLLMKYWIPAFLCLTGILLLTGCCQRKEITTSSQFSAENKTSTGTDHFPKVTATAWVDDQKRKESISDTILPFRRGISSGRENKSYSSVTFPIEPIKQDLTCFSSFTKEKCTFFREKSQKHLQD